MIKYCYYYKEIIFANVYVLLNKAIQVSLTATLSIMTIEAHILLSYLEYYLKIQNQRNILRMLVATLTGRFQRLDPGQNSNDRLV